jgi:ParB family chromosome partitioning protein
MSRLAALNNAFDALQAEQAARQHLFHLRREKDAIQPARPRGQPREGKMPMPATEPDRPTVRTITVAIGRIYLPEAELDELAQSIRQQGVLQPLLVRPRGDDFEIIAGARRWRAAQRAQLHEVPVILHMVGDAEALELALIENLQREDLTPIEEAEAYRRLLKLLGCTQKDLALSLGKSIGRVANTLRLLALPDSVRRYIDEGTLSFSHGRALLADPDPTAAAKEVVRRRLSAPATEQLIQRRAQGPRRAWHSRTADSIATEKTLSQRLGLRVRLRLNSHDGGSIIIRFETQAQLNHVAGLLLGDTLLAAAAAA